jgi:hypothetical protein
MLYEPSDAEKQPDGASLEAIGNSGAKLGADGTSPSCFCFFGNGGDDETRKHSLCRDSLGMRGLSATYVLSGGCQVAGKDSRNRSLRVNLWVRPLGEWSQF